MDRKCKDYFESFKEIVEKHNERRRLMRKGRLASREHIRFKTCC